MALLHKHYNLCPLFTVALTLAVTFTLNSCASTAPAPEPAAECPSGEFRGFGVGESENEALSEARSALAGQISSSVNVTIERIVSQKVSNGKEDLNSGYESKTVIESALPNAQDARIASKKPSGSKTSIVVCIAKADAAKGFLEKQRLLADSLGLASNAELNTEHPRHKNEAWRKTQMLYNDFARIQNLLDGWGVKSPYAVEEIYSRAREDYKNYCGAARLHWNPEMETPYSEVAFANLSQKVKIEKSPCEGRGISLVCKIPEPKCEQAGIFKCSLQPSLLIASCEGREYSLLEGGSISGFHQKEEVALEKLQAKFREEAFWKKWEHEIQQWRPQCE